MTPAIANVAGCPAIDAADFVWLDMSSVPRNGAAMHYARATELGVPTELRPDPFDKQPFPFNRFAVALQHEVYGPNSLAVFVISAEQFLIHLLHKDLGHSLLDIRTTIEPNGKGLYNEYYIDPDYTHIIEQIKKPGETSEEAWNALRGQLVFDTLWAFHGVFGEPKMYSATASHRNPKRIAKGKKPLFSWTTVQITPPAPPTPSPSNLGGTHASPRLHDRRGHYRRYKTGKVAWVKTHRVGDARKGIVFHDYEARAA